jgi:Rieske Fe-S protein
MKETSNNRRNFLKGAGAVLGVGIAYIPMSALLNSCEETETIPVPPPPPPGANFKISIADYPALQTVGGFAVAVDTKDKLSFLIKRETDTEFLVCTQICPHQQCEVKIPKSAGADFNCPCHDVGFSAVKATYGQVTTNPFGVGVTALQTYTSTYDATANTLTIWLT